MDFQYESDQDEERIWWGFGLIFTFATSITTTRLTCMIREDLAQELVGTLLVQVDDGVVQGILVLFQPAGDVVWYLEEGGCSILRPKRTKCQRQESISSNVSDSVNTNYWIPAQDKFFFFFENCEYFKNYLTAWNFHIRWNYTIVRYLKPFESYLKKFIQNFKKTSLYRWSKKNCETYTTYICAYTYIAGIMANGEVSSLLTGLWWFGLQEVGRLAQVVVVQLLLKGLVGGFGEHRFFFKDGQDTHRLWNGKPISFCGRAPKTFGLFRCRMQRVLLCLLFFENREHYLGLIFFGLEFCEVKCEEIWHFGFFWQFLHLNNFGKVWCAMFVLCWLNQTYLIFANCVRTIHSKTVHRY